LFDEAMRWMRRQRDDGKPFFVFLPTAAPHSPYFVPQRYRDSVRPRVEKAALKLPPDVLANLTTYLAMIENLDENMGRLDDFLTSERLRDDTLLIYLTDNGTTLGDQYFPCGMRGKKVSLWEGGHRVPCFLRLPAALKAPAQEQHGLTQVQDIFATVLAAAGRPVPPCDGMNLLPVLLGGSRVPEDRALFINYSRMPVNDQSPELRREGSAVLWKRWRWLEDRLLYDLATDPLQQHDVAAQHPEIVALMRQKLADWWKGLPADLNEPQRVSLGHPSENPCLLTACEWWNVFVDQQGQVRRGERKNGLWHLQVAQAGAYTFELRRWPREAAAALNAPLPAKKVTDGWLGRGEALPIAAATLSIAGRVLTQKAAPQDTHITFELELPAGPAELQATFLDAGQRPLLGAYYVYVSRK
jgi:hypothetical protein